MNNHRRLVIPAAAVLILLLSGATATTSAQVPTPSPGKMPQHQAGMKDMAGMSAMTGAPHHVLAMAYRDNLVTFARALQEQVTQSKTVNLDLARPAVAEMRRSLDQMQQHHQAQMAMMGDKMTGGKMSDDKTTGDKMMGDKMMAGKMMGGQAKPPMPETMQDMKSHLAALNEHLSALESAVNVGAPDVKAVSDHLTEILKQCAGMSAMSANAKPHQMK